ncbi:MAG: hypothetical protein KDC98_04940 [Planctomycetes bacterium]|nr:hypothetical protein [Planctomycetota bacterium]
MPSSFRFGTAAPALLPLSLLLLSAAGRAQWPNPQVPPQNPITAPKTVLGKILFWEEQLSSDDSMACGTCHVPEFGGGEPRTLGTLHPGLDGSYGTADDIHGSPGLVRQSAAGDFTHDATFALARQVTRRQSPTNLGAAFHIDLFWDGRAGGTFIDPETNQVALSYAGALENQAIGPILSDVEMGHVGRSWQDVRAKLQRVRPLALATGLTPDIRQALQQHVDYPGLFAAAFGDPAITAVRIAFAIATYQRTLIPDQTPWDRFMNGQTSALTSNQQQGWALFTGSARCALCHLDPLFSDDMFHNLGLRPKAEDGGLGAVIHVPSEDGSFKTPTLRNSGLRQRLFHNGQSAALLDPSQVTDPASVLNVYLNGGGVDRSNLDPFMTVLSQYNVTPADLLQVFDFVANGLTDPRAAAGLPPFDHPQLRSMTVPAPVMFGRGHAGSAAEPFLIDTVPPWPGNASYRLGLAGGDGGGIAALGFGLQPIVPTLMAGLPWNVFVTDFQLFLLSGPAGAPGVATWHLPVPNDPLLTGLPLYFQLFAQDATAAGGVAASKGWEFVVR